MLIFSVVAGACLFLPPGMYLQPVGWLLVGGFTISIIDGLKRLAQELAVANERQRVLFQELQHRVANTLHSVSGTLEIARRRIGPNLRRPKESLRTQFAAYRLQPMYTAG